MREGPLAVLERLLEGEDGALEIPQPPDGRDAQGRWERVVGALMKIDVVRRRHDAVLAMGPAEDLERPVRQHLVHVHVGAGARAALQRVDDDLGGQAALEELEARPLEGVGGRGISHVPERAVRAQGGELHRAVCARQVGMHGQPAQREVLDGTGGVDTMEGVVRHLECAQGV